MNLIGKKFGLLTVIKLAPKVKKNSQWICLCQCGNECIATGSEMNAGRKKSCGCLRRKKKIKHGYARRNAAYNSEYNIWLAMKQRCYYKKNKHYKSYGGRGIKVCKRWLGDKGFINFLKDMGKRPTNLHSLDRFPNVNGNYKPSNCRWATQSQQARNTTLNVLYIFKGKSIIQKDLCDLLNISSTKLIRYLKKMSPDEIENYLKNKTVPNDRIKDITGQTFFNLTALRFIGINERKSALWELICTCGNKTILPSTSINKTKSCGCLATGLFGK